MIFPVIFPLSDPLVSSPWLLVTSTWRRHGSATRPASAQFLSCFVSENREYHGIPQNSIFDRENDYHGGSWGVPRYLIFGQNQVYLQPLWKNGCKIASNRAEGRRNMKHVQGTSQMKTMYFIVVCARQKTKVRCPLIPATFGPDSRDYPHILHSNALVAHPRSWAMTKSRSSNHVVVSIPFLN